MNWWLKYGLSSLLLWIPTCLVLAEDSEHYAAAERLFESTSSRDVSALSEQISTAMLSRMPPEIQVHRQLLQDFIYEIATSKEYRDLKVRSYMNHLSEAQLNELTAVFSGSAYQRFRAKQVEMLQESNEGIMKLFRDKGAELERRISDAEKRESGD